MQTPQNKHSLCGLNCFECPAYIAFKTNDNSLRIKTAEEWVKEYNNPNFKPEDINCTGCLSDEEPIQSHCKVCEIRKCGLAKGLKNCGECADYPNCKIVAGVHAAVSSAKEFCDKIYTNTAP